MISNFVEGYLKKDIANKQHFLEISETSLLELETQSEICFLLGYWKEDTYSQFDKKRSEVGYLLSRYRLKVR